MTMTEGARRVAAGFTATGGVTRGADLIEQQLLGQATEQRRVVAERSKWHRHRLSASL